MTTPNRRRYPKFYAKDSAPNVEPFMANAGVESAGRLAEEG